jgi:peptide/nickel transport system substrate-binding protein
MKTMIRAALAAFGVLAVAAAPASAQHLRIALREDPDILDPTLSRTYVGRIVYMALCDKLFDINEKLPSLGRPTDAHCQFARRCALSRQ